MKSFSFCLIALLLTGIQLSADQKAGEEIKWQVMSNGGMENAVIGSYTLSGTLGQPTAGPCVVGGYEVQIGYRQNFTSGEYLCGDADGSGSINISDAVYLIQYIFAEGPPPDPLAAADSDCSGGINMSDVVYLIQYIFAEGPTPCDPNGDGTPDC